MASLPGAWSQRPWHNGSLDWNLTQSWTEGSLETLMMLPLIKVLYFLFTICFHLISGYVIKIAPNMPTLGFPSFSYLEKLPSPWLTHMLFYGLPHWDLFSWDLLALLLGSPVGPGQMTSGNSWASLFALVQRLCSDAWHFPRWIWPPFRTGKLTLCFSCCFLSPSLSLELAYCMISGHIFCEHIGKGKAGWIVSPIRLSVLLSTSQAGGIYDCQWAWLSKI